MASLNPHLPFLNICSRPCPCRSGPFPGASTNPNAKVPPHKAPLSAKYLASWPAVLIPISPVERHRLVWSLPSRWGRMGWGMGAVRVVDQGTICNRFSISRFITINVLLWPFCLGCIFFLASCRSFFFDLCLVRGSNWEQWPWLLWYQKVHGYM